MYHFMAAGLGVLIALMITVNSRFAAALGNLPSSLLVHLTGLALVSLILLIRREEKTGITVPFYLRLGGFVGVSLVLFNNICFLALGASLTISLGIVGQTLGGQIVDATGFLGMKKHPFLPAKLPGWALVLAGALLMTGGSPGNWPYMVLAFVTGALVMLASVLNAQLGRRMGLFRATRINYIAGLITVGVLLLIFQTSLDSYRNLPEVPLLIILGGGTLGVLVTTGMNFVIPRIPAVYSTILIFLGQVSAGLLIDIAMTRSVSWPKTAGAAIILLGLFQKSRVDRRVRLRDAQA